LRYHNSKHGIFKHCTPLVYAYPILFTNGSLTELDSCFSQRYC